MDREGLDGWDEDLGSRDGDRDNQELEEHMDLASCWRVIARQSSALERQQATLTAVTNQLTNVQLQLSRLMNQPQIPDGAGGNGPGGPAGNSQITIDQLSQALANKGAPPPEPYVLASGRSFDRFVAQFETYCQGKYSTTSYERWTSELGKYLKDEMYTMYQQYGGGEENLTTMKEKLRRFCQGEEERSLARNLEKFTAARPGPDESSYMYAARLERLFTSSHPGVNPETNVDLKVKFLTSIHATDRSDIQRDLDNITAVSTNEQETNSWKKLMGVVKRRHDRNLYSSATIKNEPAESTNPIWYTSTSFQDARLCEDYPDFRRSRSSYRPTGSFYPRSYSREPRRNPPIYNAQSRSRSMSRDRNRRYSENENQTPNRPLVICDWCGNPGHIQRNCWRKLGCCLRCGSDQHIVRQCPKPPRQSRRQNQQSRYPGLSSLNGQQNNQNYPQNPQNYPQSPLNYPQGPQHCPQNVPNQPQNVPNHPPQAPGAQHPVVGNNGSGQPQNPLDLNGEASA